MRRRPCAGGRAGQELTGILGSHGTKACCPEGCGECGGTDCEHRPGGRELCCALKIKYARRPCDTHQPPCFPYAGSRHTRHRAARPLVVNLGFAKTGTTSLAQFFRCNNFGRVVHWVGCGRPQRLCAIAALQWLAEPYDDGRYDRDLDTLGPTNITSSDPEDLRMFMRSARREAAADGEASFRAGMGNPDVVAEFGLHDGCLFPQIGHLHTLLTRLPRACFVLTHRPVERWLASVRAHNSMLPQLLASCPLEPRNESGLARWYTSFIALAAAALATRPCAAVLNIEDPATGHQLAEVFNGTNASCWGKHHTSAAREATLTSRACVRPQECEPHTWSVPRHHVKPHGHAHRSAGRLALQNLRVH